MRHYKLVLNLFDGEGAAAAPAGEGQSVSGSAPGEPAAEGAESAAGTAAPEGTERPSFEDLIHGEYKADADRYIQNLIRGRVKNANKTISDQKAILSVVAGKYGMDPDNLDLKALGEKVSQDDIYYEQKAMEEGLTPDQYRRIATAEQRSREFEAQLRQNEQERQIQAQVAEWQTQAQGVKEVFPDFDLTTEMKNPTFQKLLHTGVDMKSAYVSLHSAEILQGAMNFTAKEVRKATAENIAARGQRPRENASSSQAAATVKVDVSKLTRADREEMSRRAARGEIITLG